MNHLQHRRRKPILAIFGDVDAGKTKLHDTLLGSVATNSGKSKVKERRSCAKSSFVSLPGLLERFPLVADLVLRIQKTNSKAPSSGIAPSSLPNIDGFSVLQTPGMHDREIIEAISPRFCDIAVIVLSAVSWMPDRTYEQMFHSLIRSLQRRSCPIVVVLNKIDRIGGWNRTDVSTEGETKLSASQSPPPKLLRTVLGHQPIETVESLQFIVDSICTEFIARGYGHLTPLGARTSEPSQEGEPLPAKSPAPLIPISAETKTGLSELIAILANQVAQMRNDECDLQPPPQQSSPLPSLQPSTSSAPPWPRGVCISSDDLDLSSRSATITIEGLLLDGCVREGDSIFFCSKSGTPVSGRVQKLFEDAAQEQQIVDICEASHGLKIGVELGREQISGGPSCFFDQLDPLPESIFYVLPHLGTTSGDEEERVKARLRLDYASLLNGILSTTDDADSTTTGAGQKKKNAPMAEPIVQGQRFFLSLRAASPQHMRHLISTLRLCIKGNESLAQIFGNIFHQPAIMNNESWSACQLGLPPFLDLGFQDEEAMCRDVPSSSSLSSPSLDAKIVTALHNEVKEKGKIRTQKVTCVHLAHGPRRKRTVDRQERSSIVEVGRNQQSDDGSSEQETVPRNDVFFGISDPPWEHFRNFEDFVVNAVDQSILCHGPPVNYPVELTVMNSCTLPSSSQTLQTQEEETLLVEVRFLAGVFAVGTVLLVDRGSKTAEGAIKGENEKLFTKGTAGPNSSVPKGYQQLGTITKVQYGSIIGKRFMDWKAKKLFSSMAASTKDDPEVWPGNICVSINLSRDRDPGWGLSSGKEVKESLPPPSSGTRSSFVNSVEMKGTRLVSLMTRPNIDSLKCEPTRSELRPEDWHLVKRLAKEQGVPTGGQRKT